MSGTTSRLSLACKVFVVFDTDQRRAAGGLFLLMLLVMALAEVNGFVATQPEGMHTFVGERAKRLSSGQRIDIARALDHYRATLVLDEVAGALDVATETAVMKAVAALQRRKIIVIEARGLEAAEQCDWLCRLESGRVMQTGLPAEVLDQLVRTADAAVPSME